MQQIWTAIKTSNTIFSYNLTLVCAIDTALLDNVWSSNPLPVPLSPSFYLSLVLQNVEFLCSIPLFDCPLNPYILNLPQYSWRQTEQCKWREESIKRDEKGNMMMKIMYFYSGLTSLSRIWIWPLTSFKCKVLRMCGALPPLSFFAFIAWCLDTGTTCLTLHQRLL